jgi:signal transduction histidine kinase
MDQKDSVAASILRARKALDRALEDLEKIPAFHSETVAFAAHALNNYLTVIAGTVDLLMMSLADHPNPEMKTWLEGLRHVTELMTRTVVQLVTAAPVPPARLDFEADLAVLVSRTTAYYQRIAARKPITLTFESTGEVPLVRADRVALVAVLDNLLSNAIKYSHPGKRVWVEVHGEQNSAVCSVRDEGPGLSDADRTRLFQRGVRLTPTPTAGEPTSGYGLGVAKELADQMGAQLWCESRLGQGARFSLRLPVAPDSTGAATR